MTDPLRRQDDALLSGVDKRLALLELAHQLRGEAEKARAESLESAVKGLAAKVDAAIVLWQNVTAEPSASPAGRALNARLNELDNQHGKHDEDIENLKTWRDEMAGSFKTVRAVLLVLSGLVSILTILTIVLATRPAPLG